MTQGWVPVSLWLETVSIYISGQWAACTLWSDSNYLWGLMMAWPAPWIQQLLQLLKGLWQGHSSREGGSYSTGGTDCDVLWKLMRVHLARQSESWFFVFVFVFFALKNILKDYMSSLPLLSPFLQAFREADRGVKWKELLPNSDNPCFGLGHSFYFHGSLDTGELAVWLTN